MWKYALGVNYIHAKYIIFSAKYAPLSPPEVIGKTLPQSFRGREVSFSIIFHTAFEECGMSL